MLRKFKYVFVALVATGLIYCLSNVSTAFDEPPATVTVQVLGLGAPIPDSEVSVGGLYDITGPNGNYVFQVDKGIYTVSCKGAHGGEDSKEVHVRPGEIIQVTFDLGAEGLHAGEHHWFHILTIGASGQDIVLKPFFV